MQDSLATLRYYNRHPIELIENHATQTTSAGVKGVGERILLTPSRAPS